MKNKFFLFSFIIIILFLTGCSSSAITTKSGLISESNNFKRSVDTQDKLLTRLEKELNAVQDSFNDAKDADDLEDIQNNLDSRQDTLDQIKTEVNKQSTLVSGFNSTVKKNNKNFPNNALNQLVKSDDITKLDYESFQTYLKEGKKSEKSIIELLKADSVDDDQLNQESDTLNTYYSAMIQQLEIWQVNLSRVNRDANNLLKQLK